MVLGVTFTAEDNCDITLDVNGFDMYNRNTRDQASASMFTFEKGTNAHLTVVNTSENRETKGGIFYYPSGTDISNSVFHMEGGYLTIEDVGGDNLTDAERAALEALKGTARALLDRIAASKDAAEADEITAADGITKDNVKLEDKEGLEKAADEIAKLSKVDDAKLSDKDEVDRVKKIIGGLTENEKSMLGKDALGKLDALTEKIQKLAEKTDAPKTGDTSNPLLWIALLIISGSVVIGTVVVSKKKKRSGK